ncbi:MAG: hypothetical protein QM770_19985 [Tepidisphaeraceae bacterium]
MKIYAALLGREVRIDPVVPRRDAGVELRMNMAVNLKLGGTRSPFLTPTWSDRIGHWCALAVKAFDRARQRLSTPRVLRSIERSATSDTVPPGPTPIAPVTTIKARPVILVGPAVTKRNVIRRSTHSHAA